MVRLVNSIKNDEIIIGRSVRYKNITPALFVVVAAVAAAVVAVVAAAAAAAIFLFHILLFIRGQYLGWVRPPSGSHFLKNRISSNSKIPEFFLHCIKDLFISALPEVDVDDVVDLVTTTKIFH